MWSLVKPKLSVTTKLTDFLTAVDAVVPVALESKLVVWLKSATVRLGELT